MTEVQLCYLADHPEYIEPLARKLQEVFGPLNPTRTLEFFILKISQHTNRDKIPLSLLLLEGDELIGSVSLRPYDLDTHLHLTPWLASLFVIPTRQNQGYGERLLNAAVEKAKELGYKELYLFTPDKQVFYTKRGWQSIEKVMFNGFPADIMIMKLGNE